MDLLQLKYFRSAAQLQNFSRVAEKYMIPQSAVSKTISNLENELECSLFDRVGKKVILNERGKIFLQSVDSALNSLDEGVIQLKNAASQQIRLCVKAGNKIIPSLLSDFQKINPHISFLLKKYNDASDKSDFYITTLPVEKEEDFLPLLTEKIVLAVPKNHRLYEYDEISLTDIKNEKFIGFHKGRNMRQIVDKCCMEHGFIPNMLLEAEDAATFREMVEQQMGLAFVPDKIWNTKKNANVKTMQIKEGGFERTLVIAWKKNDFLSRNMLDFRKFAVHWFSKL